MQHKPVNPSLGCLNPSYLMKRGALLTIVPILVIALTGYLFMLLYRPAFSLSFDRRQN